MVAEFTGVRDRRRRARRRRTCTPAHSGAAVARRRRRRRRRRAIDRAAARLPALRTPTRRRRGGRPTIRPTAPRPRPASCSPTRRPAATTCASVIAAIVDDGDLLELRAGGRRTSSPASRRSAASPSASSPTSRSRSPARSTSRPRRRARASSASATRSTCRSSRWSTRPASIPGKDLEWRGMIRHGAQLAFAYARATVPRICVILRKSYGGAYIVMDSKKMGNDLCLAWPTRRARRHGRRRRRRDPAPPGHARGAGAARGRLRGAAPQPVRRGRAGLRRRRDRAGRHACGDRTRARDARQQAGVDSSDRKHDNTPL